MVMDILEGKVILFPMFSLYLAVLFTLCFSGLEGKIENATHIDFNGDGIIGRPLDTFPGGGVYPPPNYGGPGPYQY